jgi:integrase
MRQSDLFIQPKRPWNAGRLIGPKAPLKPKHIWTIRQQLKGARRVRDLAMFNCALDSKLRACDLVRLRVSDVAPSGVLRQRSIVIQQKTGRPVPFEITEPARDAIAAWLSVRGQRDDDWLFPSRSRLGQHIGRLVTNVRCWRYADLIAIADRSLAASIGVPDAFRSE